MAILRAMKTILEKLISEALVSLQQEGALPHFSLPEVQLEEPKSAQFGEYTSSIAMRLAKEAKCSPLTLAESICEKLAYEENFTVSAVPPGYLNFRLSDIVLTERLGEILSLESFYGNGEPKKGLKINNEFISANPTGPLHVGNGRGGYFGDSLTKLLKKMGHQVTSEYYVNDGGEQISKLGHSILKDDEAVYTGEYIDELHTTFSHEKDVEKVGQFGAKHILEHSIRKTVRENMGIHFDTWTSEKELLQKKFVDRALDSLKECGHTYEQDGALWLRTTTFGDDKDRVLRKQNGNLTYFASDAGHILSYLEQDMEVIIETFGADHHGYTKRFEAVARALGFKGVIRFNLMQLVQIEKDGKPYRMSKRAGTVINMDDLIELVGKDVTRFFFLLYSPETHMTLDLARAKERSEKNPVFYVQYAHARMCSILRKAQDMNFCPQIKNHTLDEKERMLLRELYLFPEFLERAAQDFAPHRLTQYSLHLSDLFHSFYAKLKVLDEKEKVISGNRLAIVLGTKIVLSETLALLGITAPEKM